MKLHITANERAARDRSFDAAVVGGDHVLVTLLIGAESVTVKPKEGRE